LKPRSKFIPCLLLLVKFFGFTVAETEGAVIQATKLEEVPRCILSIQGSIESDRPCEVDDMIELKCSNVQAFENF
jgi:hypothetical protein